jgi:hypothetical protein
MANLKEFVAAVKSEGLMRNNRFSVFFSIPSGIEQSFDLRKVMLYCDSVALPSVTVETAQARTFGEFREMPYNRLFDNITMSFYVDNSMQVKLLFDQWVNSIQDPTTRTFNYYKTYTTDLNIDVFDVAEGQRYQVVLYEAYPKAISAIQMDYANKDVMKLSVSMNYKYWLSSATSSTSAAAQSSTGSSILNKLFASNGLIGNALKIPTQYFTNFNSYQTGFQSFEQGRAPLFGSSSQGISTGTGIGSLKKFI